MQPDDSRHGTYAGANQHWIHKTALCAACARAATRYNKQRKLEALRYGSRLIPAYRVTRRKEALRAIGWSMPAIAAETGISTYALHQIGKKDTVRRELFDRFAAAYERLCMDIPKGRYVLRTRLIAARAGFMPPLAWDDIDDPDETPAPFTRVPMRQTDVDHAIVLRVLAGGKRPRNLTNAEAAEVMRHATAKGMSGNQIERLYGLKPDRYTKGKVA